jgi:hypothetical protein
MLGSNTGRKVFGRIQDKDPLFGSLPRDARLHHVGTRHYPSGLVKSEYEVVA